MENNKPLLICLTSTRNYGWITSLFLKANSIWADYIIMVDQMSTDGTRELARSNPKVILLDNEDMTYSETKRSEMAINRAREINGDKILIYLAIDEILSANYCDTNDWKRILESKPKDVFCLTWANLLPDNKHFLSVKNKSNNPFWMARIFHDDGQTPYNNEGLDMHTHCIPYPQSDVNEFYIEDFKILHFAYYSESWNKAKQRFYQFVDYDKNKRTATVLNRMYKSPMDKIMLEKLSKKWVYNYKLHSFDMFSEVDLETTSFFDNYVLEFIDKNGLKHYEKLNVWDKDFRQKYNISDPRRINYKLLHSYFNITHQFQNVIFVRLIDKLLKMLGV